MLHKIEPARKVWPQEKNYRYEALITRLITRIMEMDAIAKFALEEEATACYQIVSEDLEEMRRLARETMADLNAHIVRHHRIVLREMKQDGIDITDLEMPMKPGEQLIEARNNVSLAFELGDKKKIESALKSEHRVLTDHPEALRQAAGK